MNQLPQQSKPIPTVKMVDEITYLAGGRHEECPGHVKRRVYSRFPGGDGKPQLVENHYPDSYDR